MIALAPDGDYSRNGSLRLRLSQRLVRHTRTAPARLAPAAPLVSFTFDDAPVCACTVGADMLDAHGAKGTFYIAGELIGTRAQHWRLADDAQIAALHAGGHEIACHTYSHPFMPGLTEEAIVAQTRRNGARLREIVPDLALESFAFPYGLGSMRAKRALRALYASSRGIVRGLNVGRADLQFLRANPLVEARMDEAELLRLMDEALARNAWLIFYGHDVALNPSPYGCSPGFLETALRAASERGIACVGVAEGLRRSLAGPSAESR